MPAQPLSVVCGFIASGVCALLAQAPEVGPFAGWLQYGALGILAGTIVGLFMVILKQIEASRIEREAFQKVIGHLATRWDAWEKVRHEDSEKVNRTLADLSVTCALTGRVEPTR